ncbi:hypothetical protein NEAUS07_1733 [Nematocida ausubeli]|nr:hypothetical protein NEAUS07_1733 [Nematocida ausubeli]
MIGKLTKSFVKVVSLLVFAYLCQVQASHILDNNSQTSINSSIQNPDPASRQNRLPVISPQNSQTMSIDSKQVLSPNSEENAPAVPKRVSSLRLYFNKNTQHICANNYTEHSEKHIDDLEAEWMDEINNALQDMEKTKKIQNPFKPVTRAVDAYKENKEELKAAQDVFCGEMEEPVLKNSGLNISKENSEPIKDLEKQEPCNNAKQNIQKEVPINTNECDSSSLETTQEPCLSPHTPESLSLPECAEISYENLESIPTTSEFQEKPKLYMDVDKDANPFKGNNKKYLERIKNAIAAANNVRTTWESYTEQKTSEKTSTGFCDEHNKLESYILVAKAMKEIETSEKSKNK